jgi:hypothetical protein
MLKKHPGGLLIAFFANIGERNKLTVTFALLRDHDLKEIFPYVKP